MTAIEITAVSLLAIVSLIFLLTRLDSGHRDTLLRLDWFVPALRRLPADQSPSTSMLGRLVRRSLPARLQSDRATKRRGLIRRWLRSLGPSWLMSPLRRVVQTTCLIVFVVLFCWTCWPYNARPRQLGLVSSEWTLVDVDQQSGRFRFRSDLAASIDSVDDLQDVFLFDPSAVPIADGRIGKFIVSTQGDDTVLLEPDGDIGAAAIDAILTRAGAFDFYATDPTAWPSHYADNLASKEFVPAESFLIIDPLVSLSTAIASRSWVWSLVSAGVILLVCVLIPRGFCGYLCPLGTTIDLFDWAIGRRISRFRVQGDGWWVHIKYYLLAGTLIASLGGVLVSGFVSAIPVITRAMLFIVDPFQNGVARSWHLVPGIGVGQVLSIAMFAVVLGLGLLRPRFWCKYICPSGAVFSIGNLFRITERKVESSCINCNKCVEVCPFDAIKPDFTTRTTDCTLCQTCGGVCPTQAIKFVERNNLVELKIAGVPPTGETALGRRGFLSLATGGTAATAAGIGIVGVTKSWGANLDDPDSFRPVRPPGSVPEQDFLQLCIRCGECFKACPNNVLQPEAFEQGLEGLWSPMVNADWAGCESSCNACGQVCPTGAIRALPIEEKRHARMGLAIVNEATCLPFAGTGACDLCVQECKAAGYNAIEYTQVGVEVDDDGRPIDGTGFLAPVVLPDACVGCGLCQTRCYAINVKEEKLITESAIIVLAGPGREDRMMTGSYIKQPKSAGIPAAKDSSIDKPPVDKFPVDSAPIDTDPFGTESPF